MDEEYDVIVLETGLKECILSGLLSVDGLKSKDPRSVMQFTMGKLSEVLNKPKAACSVTLGMGEESINASAVLVMPMVSSKITDSRKTVFDRPKVFSLKNLGWSKISMDEDGVKVLDSPPELSQSV